MVKSFLDHAYFEALKAYEIKEVPVGAIIVQNETIIASAYNQKETLNDCTEHAEMAVIRKASKLLQQWRLLDCDIYCSLEPCLMCATAIIHARIKNVYYGVKDNKWGGETHFNIFSQNYFNHKVNSNYIEHKKSKVLLKNFFKERRKQA